MVSLSLEERFRFHLINYQVFERLLEQSVRLFKILDFLLLGRLSCFELLNLGTMLLDHLHAVGLILTELLFRGNLPLDKLFLVAIHLKALAVDFFGNLVLLCLLKRLACSWFTC